MPGGRPRTQPPKYNSLQAMGEIVDEIKTVHCRKEYVQVETWDYFDEVS